jgi:hypothetical protein
MSRSIVVLVLAFGLLVAVPSACRIYEPSNRPLDQCRLHCVNKAGRECSEGECGRGCEMILDRIVERESDHVIACVAASARRCSDVVWADCAARVGFHADGGPPVPVGPLPEEE